MPDFNQADPKKHITDPKNLGANAQYPSHLFKFTAEPSPTSIVVAWKGKEPVRNEIVDAANEADEAAKVKDGYALKPVLEAPEAPEAKKASAVKKGKKDAPAADEPEAKKDE